MSRAGLMAALVASGPDKHTALLTHAKTARGLGHGNANALALRYRRAAVIAPDPVAGADPLDAIHAGKTAGLLPVHDAVMAVVSGSGPCEVAPERGHVALRRKKLFAKPGPKGAGTVEVGINQRDPLPDPPFKAMPPGGLCQDKVQLSWDGAVDPALAADQRRSRDAAD